MNFPSFDTDLLLLINQNYNVIMDNVMVRFSDTWTWSVMLLSVIFVVLRDRPVKEAVTIFFGIGLCILMADQISASLIRPWIGRLRPTHDPELMFQIRHIAGKGGLYGFVSSHAANTFAVATFLSLIFKHRIMTVALIVWASIVGYSRIYLGVHYPLDVVGGAVLGAAIGGFVYLLVHFITVKFLGFSQQYYSSAYTPSGFQRDDMHIILTIMAFTLAYTLF